MTRLLTIHSADLVASIDGRPFLARYIPFHAGTSPAVVKGAVLAQSSAAGAASAASLDAAPTRNGRRG